MDNPSLWTEVQRVQRVVQRADNYIQQINHYPADKMYWLEYIIFIHWKQFICWIELFALKEQPGPGKGIMNVFIKLSTTHQNK